MSFNRPKTTAIDKWSELGHLKALDILISRSRNDEETITKVQSSKQFKCPFQYLAVGSFYQPA